MKINTSADTSAAPSPTNNSVTDVKPFSIDDDDDGGSRLSCCGKLRFFVKQSCKDICRHPCQFCLSFCSVFTVVLSILVVISITEKGPIIFLSLGEKQIGQYDAVINPNFNGKTQTFSDYVSSGLFLNYTQIKDITSDKYNLSPRMQFGAALLDYDETTWQASFIDTQREKDIGIGTDWPYDPLGAGECIVTSEYEDASEGDTV